MHAARFRWILFLGLCLAFTLTLSPSLAQAGGLTVAPTHGLLGTAFQFSGTGFSPNELVSLWVNYPDGRVVGQGYAQADSSGAASFTVTPDTTYPFGGYVQVARGLSSQYEVTAAFNLDWPQSSGGSHSGGNRCGDGYFSATGFTPGETAATWTTRPDGISVALPNAAADSNGVVTFTFTPLVGWPAGDYIVVAQGYSSKLQGVNHFGWDGATLTGGGTCDTSNTSNSSAAPTSGSSSGSSLIPIYPKNIVNPQGAAVYLNTTPDALYYFDCGWKWRPMGGTVYFLVLGFKPYEHVQVGYQVLGVEDWLHTFAAIDADGDGNASFSVNTTNMTRGHYHWWFTSPSASYCGHYDPAS